MIRSLAAIELERPWRLWCPRCRVHEAFHPEACSITPAEWRGLYNMAERVCYALSTRHGRARRKR